MSRTEIAFYKRCRSHFRGFPLKRSIRSLKGSAGIKLKSPCLSPIGYDRKKKSNRILLSRTGMVNNQSSESRSKSPKSEPAENLRLPNYLGDVAEKLLEASEIMQTQIYQRLAQFHLSIQNPERVHNGEPSPADTSKVVTGRQELGDYPTRGRTLSRKVKKSTILSQSQAVFFSTLAKNIQNTVRNVEGLLQEAYLDLRFIRQVISGPELDTSEELEEELEILLDKINQFSISDPSRSRRRTTLREHFQLSLDNIAEEKEES